MRRLIVNADDFGLTSGVNRAIVEGHQRGIVTSTTLMACGARFDDAVSVARNHPQLSVGCHVVLVDGHPLSNAASVPSLLESASGPKFRDSLSGFAIVAVSGRLAPDELEREISAQVRHLQSAGIQVSHLDSHKHTHMFPVVLRALLKAAKNCGVKAIRNPFEPLIFAKLGGWKRGFQLRMMHRFRRDFRQALDSEGIKSPDGCIGVAATGGLNEESFRHLIDHLPEGTWEFVSHPGYNDADLDGVKTRLRASRETELAILTADFARDAIRSNGAELISYHEL